MLKKIQKDPDQLLLVKNVGTERTLDKETMELVSEFVRKVIYNGGPTEDYIVTRSMVDLQRLYRHSGKTLQIIRLKININDSSCSRFVSSSNQNSPLSSIHMVKI